VPHAESVFSNAKITPEQLAWLAELFGGQKSVYSDAYDINLGPGATDGVGLADGTDDIASMPPLILEPVAQLLQGYPQYRLSLAIGDTPDCRDVAWRVANEFARWWPAVWSNHSTEPVIPLGHWWSGSQLRSGPGRTRSPRQWQVRRSRTER
jgi:hypothetical protein